MSSRLLTTPSLLPPKSTRISSGSMRTTVPSTTSPCLRLLTSLSGWSSSSAIVIDSLVGGTGAGSSTASAAGSVGASAVAATDSAVSSADAASAGWAVTTSASAASTGSAVSVDATGASATAASGSSASTAVTSAG